MNKLVRINKELRDTAIEKELCDEWQKKWEKDLSEDMLVKMMFKGLDFCLANRYPSNEYIIKNFDLDFRRRNNVFVNDKRQFVCQTDSKEQQLCNCTPL